MSPFMAGGLIAAEFFRVTIALVAALVVALGVIALGYYVRRLQQKIDRLEDALEQVGSTEYLRWALDTTDEFDLGPEQDSGKRQRHLWVVPALVGGWLGNRLTRQPLATAVGAATAAVVASMATAPVLDGGGGGWSQPPAAAGEPPPSTLIDQQYEPELGEYGASPGDSTSTTSPSTTTTTIVVETQEPADATTTTTTLPPTTSTTTTVPPTTPPTTLADTKPGGGPPEGTPPTPKAENQPLAELSVLGLMVELGGDEPPCSASSPPPGP